MTSVPWRFVKAWSCVACGGCCRGYKVVLSFAEWLNIIRLYGVGVTQADISKFYLGKRGDGTCVFLYNFLDTRLCGLQGMKPRACKLWPFKILSKPNFGQPNEAEYKYRNKRFFIYVDSSCTGLRWGKPSQEFTYRTLTEIVEIATGLRVKQCYSTSKAPYRPRYIKAGGLP